jgi:hypothetical protein
MLRKEVAMLIAHRSITRFLIACGLVAALMLVPGATPARAGGVVGNGTPGSCTDAGLNTALAGGGSVTFNCGPAPHTILITSQKSINLNTTIDGGGKITLDGQDAHRLFDVGAVLTLRNIVLSRGYFNGDGGAIRNNSNGQRRGDSQHRASDDHQQSAGEQPGAQRRGAVSALWGSADGDPQQRAAIQPGDGHDRRLGRGAAGLGRRAGDDRGQRHLQQHRPLWRRHLQLRQFGSDAEEQHPAAK